MEGTPPNRSFEVDPHNVDTLVLKEFGASNKEDHMIIVCIFHGSSAESRLGHLIQCSSRLLALLASEQILSEVSQRK